MIARESLEGIPSILWAFLIEKLDEDAKILEEIKTYFWFGKNNVLAFRPLKSHEIFVTNIDNYMLIRWLKKTFGLWLASTKADLKQ